MRKKLLAIVLSAVMVLTGCTMEETAEAPKENYNIRVYSKDELENGFYYIKHGDDFYQIKAGDPNFISDNDEADYDYSFSEEEQPDSSRSFFYERDKSEKMIPTMYQDDQLVYKTQNNIRSVFEWERFVDGGYTFGIRNIYQEKSGVYMFTNYALNILKDSAIAKKIGYSTSTENENANYAESSDYADGEEPTQADNSQENSEKTSDENTEETGEDINAYWEYAISSIKTDKGTSLYDERSVSSAAVSATQEPLTQESPTPGNQSSTIKTESVSGRAVTNISDDILSPAGTIQNLDPDTEYTLDVHKGTKLYQIKTKPTARVFYNFENYWTKGLTFSEEGYAIIDVPKSFKSGYYKFENSGLFRYVDQPYQESFDLGKVNYNQAYYKRTYDNYGQMEPIQYKKIFINEDGNKEESDEYVYQ